MRQSLVGQVLFAVISLATFTTNGKSPMRSPAPVGTEKSATVYECFPFIWPYNARTGQVAAPNLGKVLLQALSLQTLSVFG
jgi:hypothetical protein